MNQLIFFAWLAFGVAEAPSNAAAAETLEMWSPITVYIGLPILIVIVICLLVFAEGFNRFREELRRACNCSSCYVCERCEVCNLNCVVCVRCESCYEDQS